MAKVPDHNYGGCLWCQNKCIGTITGSGGGGAKGTNFFLGRNPPRNPFLDLPRPFLDPFLVGTPFPRPFPDPYLPKNPPLPTQEPPFL